MLQENLDLIWIMICAALVLLMQAGFTALETGVTRAKNSINVAMKNITDFVLSVLIFFLVGYAFMFGDSAGGYIGTNFFALNGATSALDYASFVFQATFAGTAATIVSGAVAERMRFSAYAMVSVLLIAFIYPISGHWIWNENGWLAQLQMVDFAGSTVVHSLGAWVGLAGAIILGPRLDKFKDGQVNHIQGHNLILAVFGVLVLWFGWIGFNGGSTLSATADIAKIVANTMVAAAAGGLSCFVTSLVLNKGEVRIEKLLNGIIGGLVTITAGCSVVEPGAAFLLGFIGGIVVYFGEELLVHAFKIDDPVSVVAAHGFAGAWGTLALAFAAPVDALPLGNAWQQFTVQLYGVAAIFFWGFGSGLVIFSLLKMFGILRVSQEGEMMGLNYHEHKASSGFIDTMQTMEQIIQSQGKVGQQGDLTRRIEVERGSESGDIAFLFNKLMDQYHDTILKVKNSIYEVTDISEKISGVSESLDNKSQDQINAMNEGLSALEHLEQTMITVQNHVLHSRQFAGHVSGEITTGKVAIEQLNTVIFNLAENIDQAYTSMSEVKSETEMISNILEDIQNISEQTNLLALNAAIEAARAGEVGRGFSVVAEEVRALSSRVSYAAADIEKTIKKLVLSAANTAETMQQSKTFAEQGVKHTQSSEQLLEQLNDMANDIENNMDSIHQATDSHNTAVIQLKSTMDYLHVTSQNSVSDAKQIAKTSFKMDEISGVLADQVNNLKVSTSTKTLH